MDQLGRDGPCGVGSGTTEEELTAAGGGVSNKTFLLQSNCGVA